MAQVTTTKGDAIDFDPADVTAITNMELDTGEVVTCIFGIEPGPLRTNEAVPDFLARCKLTAKVAELTRPDFSPIWIVAAAVTSLQAPLPDLYPAGVQAVVAVLGLTQAVRENVQDARAALDAVGAHL